MQQMPDTAKIYAYLIKKVWPQQTTKKQNDKNTQIIGRHPPLSNADTVAVC